nr:MAG: putative coat protein [Trichoderma gamsii alphapartitivirus 1]
MSTAASSSKSAPSRAALEDQFIHAYGLNSKDEIDPAQFDDFIKTVRPPLVSVTTQSAAPIAAPELPKSSADAKTGATPEVASDILAPFMGIRISYASRKKLSSFWPSSSMMFYVVHLMNARLVDHFYFKRYCPSYHPYILRLYFAILFYIQCLRAASDVNALPEDQHQFLIRFLQAHPSESLPVPGPLLTLFKSICTSQPEIQSYGKIYPRIPPSPGPERRSEFRLDNSVSFFQPNVPGIFALLTHLDGVINGANPIYPPKGKHIPVTATATNPEVFGFHTFPVPTDRSDAEKWSLNSAGLEFPCEADSKLNESFAERYEDFDFPTMTANDDLSSITNYLGMKDSLSWFSQVKDVAAAVSIYCNGSGTLADCSPTGLSSNQLIVQYLKPTRDITAPTRVADPLSRFPFSFHLSTTARQPPQLAESIAAQAQTNIRCYADHPYAGDFGNETHRPGEFWKVRPIEKSSSDYESYLGLIESVKQMIKSRV